METQVAPRSAPPTFAPRPTRRPIYPAVYSACDVCGAHDPERLFDSKRLDGPLVRCRYCGLLYVGTRRNDFAAAAMASLKLVNDAIEDAERSLRARADRERLQRLRRHVSGGRLLDVGAAAGQFMAVAHDAFTEVIGIEPDPVASAQGRDAGFDVRTGNVEDLQLEGGFDAVAMLRVVEHLDSPRAALQRVRDLLRPGGVVLIETPTVDNRWFERAPSRWRQLIPDRYYFFSRHTLEILLRTCGLEPVEHQKVSRRVSTRFAADRLRRAGLPGHQLIPPVLNALHVDARTIRINPGDIMSVVAVRGQ